jgi:hypothetical protein
MWTLAATDREVMCKINVLSSTQEDDFDIGSGFAGEVCEKSRPYRDSIPGPSIP